MAGSEQLHGCYATIVVGASLCTSNHTCMVGDVLWCRPGPLARAAMIRRSTPHSNQAVKTRLRRRATTAPSQPGSAKPPTAGNGALNLEAGHKAPGLGVHHGLATSLGTSLGTEAQDPHLVVGHKALGLGVHHGGALHAGHDAVHRVVHLLQGCGLLAAPACEDGSLHPASLSEQSGESRANAAGAPAALPVGMQTRLQSLQLGVAQQPCGGAVYATQMHGFKPPGGLLGVVPHLTRVNSQVRARRRAA